MTSCLGRVRMEATRKTQNRTPHVAKTAVVKWEGMAERRTTNTICYTHMGGYVSFVTSFFRRGELKDWRGSR